ncbi:CocE/NonD family hydrolase C-terminal non-catalytic domain-containing protein [Streptomyces sp. NPDC055055]
MSQDYPFTAGPSEEFPGFPGVTVGVSAAEAARMKGRGLWAADGTVDPDVARLGQTLAAAVLAHGDGGAPRTLLPPPFAAYVEEVRARALPGYHRIESFDGIRLSAFSLRQRSPGPHPLVVVPAGWTPYGWPLFLWAYLRLARRGYHVLAYTPRGLGAPGLPSTSEGFVDVAGPHDWADGSSVVDFAVDHLAPSTVGFLGASYGSGIGRLVAAHDDRVSAVAALSTWGDLAAGLLDHGTRRLAAVRTLLALTGGPMEEKFREADRAVLADFLADRNLDTVVEWCRLRSPDSYLHLTNENETPTLLSHTWHEGLFAVNQVVRTFDALEVPKRLNLWIGDHTAPEGAGLTGTDPDGPDLALEEAYAWLDHYLRGARNGVADWAAVCGQVMFTYVTEPAADPVSGEPTGERRIVVPAVREHRADWSGVTAGVETFGLTGDGAGGTDGLLLPAAEGTSGGTGWRRAFLAGVDTEATAMDALLRTGQAEWAGTPKTYDTRKIDRRHAVAWTTGPLYDPREAERAGRRVRGIPRLRLTVRSTATSATLVAHLLDVADDETARIITHEPLTVYDLMPEQDTTVTWELQATAYDVPAGHRLMLVVDSKDPLYGDASVTWTQTTLGSPEEAPSFLDLPLG